MNEVSEILIPLKAFVIKIFKISLNVRTSSERSIKNSDTLKVSVIKIFKILLNVRTLREQSRPNKNSDIYSQNITICDMCTLSQQYITNSDSKSSIIEILLEKRKTKHI